jgi:hypothetical protein
MPYGMKDGDTKESEKWMENCVQKVMKGGKKDKESAVAICKNSYEKTHGNTDKAEILVSLILDEDLKKRRYTV